MHRNTRNLPITRDRGDDIGRNVDPANQAIEHVADIHVAGSVGRDTLGQLHRRGPGGATVTGIAKTD